MEAPSAGKHVDAIKMAVIEDENFQALLDKIRGFDATERAVFHEALATAAIVIEREGSTLTAAETLKVLRPLGAGGVVVMAMFALFDAFSGFIGTSVATAVIGRPAIRHARERKATAQARLATLRAACGSEPSATTI